MTARSRYYVALAFAVTAICAAVLAGLAGWPEPYRTPELAGLMLLAMAVAALAPRRFTSPGWATMPPSFVVEFTALLLLGPRAFVGVVTASAIMQVLSETRSRHRFGRALLYVLTVAAAAEAGGFVHDLAAGSTGSVDWPEQAVPIAFAILTYCLVICVSADVLVPLIVKQPSRLKWSSALQGVPSHVLGATIAIGLAAIVQHDVWELAPVAVLPLCFLHRAYRAHVLSLDEERRRREVIDAVDHGMSAIDADGRVVYWSDGLERVLNCPRQRALGESLVTVLPALAKTDLLKVIADVQANGSPRTMALPGALAVAGSGRAFQVKVVRADSGVMLLWDNVTGRTNVEQSLKRMEERLTLLADGANDGLWEWDLRSQEFYCSVRWRSMLGVAASANTGSIADWLDRVHPDDRAELRAALDTHLAGKTDHVEHAHRIQMPDGKYTRVTCRGVAVRGPGGAVRIGGSLTEIRERSMAAGLPYGEAYLDPLTGLANRAVFVENLGRRLTEFKQRIARSPFAALYLDLDRFKVVNDSLGHLVGDQLLTAVSRRLEACLRRGDALARLGGDEFAILLNELGDANQANAIAFRIQDALSKPFPIEGREVFCSASIGIAFGHAQYNNPDEMMRDADTAMYHAKARGKARHELFDAAMHARELDRLGLETDLRRAVDTNAFEVHYQPIVRLDSGMCVGFESLARWTRDGKPVSPVTFIPLAEELGIIEPMGTWMLQQACSTFAGWKRRFPESALDYITVNVSSRQLMHQNFIRMVEQAVEKAGLQPCDLRLEITETALMDSPKEVALLLHELREFGTKIYLDDFGCGYSSLSHLAKLPVDALKIDRSFVKNLLLPERPAIVESILALARTLNTGVVAEGIEYESQGRELERLGCTHAQGFLFSRPLATEAAETLIAANQPLGPVKIAPPSLQWPPDLFARRRA